MTDAATTPEVTIVPANEASWEDLQAVFGTRGNPARCQCQRLKVRGREWDADLPPIEERAQRLRKQTDCGPASSPARASGAAGLAARSRAPQSTSPGNAAPVPSRAIR
jgi:hypothetical protein